MEVNENIDKVVNKEADDDVDQNSKQDSNQDESEELDTEGFEYKQLLDFFTNGISHFLKEFAKTHKTTYIENIYCQQRNTFF